MKVINEIEKVIIRKKIIIVFLLILIGIGFFSFIPFSIASQYFTDHGTTDENLDRCLYEQYKHNYPSDGQESIPFSAVENISELSCGGEIQLSGLSILKNLKKFSGSSILKEDTIIIDGNEFVLQNSSSLQTLTIDSNNINQLVISNNEKLEQIIFNRQSSFRNVDLKNNALTSLEFDNITVGGMDASNNQISSVNIGENTSIDRLDLSNNKIASLNLPTNSGGSNSAIILSNNNLLSLDLKNYSAGSSNLSPQSRTFNLKKQNDKYQLNLREYDNNLNPSKVEFTPIDGVTYDKNTGIFTFTKEIKNINYIYNVKDNTTMQVNLTLNYLVSIDKFYIGGSSNPKYATSLNTKIYLNYGGENVTQYCINTINSSDNCDWKSLSNNEINYTLPVGDGPKTLYAFVKNDSGLISEVKSDEIILDTTSPIINTFYIGGQTNPQYSSSTTSSVYLTWNDLDVKNYCVNTTSSSAGCDWKTTTGNSLTASYTLANSNGTQKVYAYLKDEVGHISEVKEDSIILDTISPTIQKFYIGGQSNPDYITDINTSIYLLWNDEDVASYCINTINSTNGCNWQNTSNKSVNTNYTLNGSNGNKTLYAFIKDKAGNISNLKEDTVTLDSIKPIIETFYIGGIDNPEYATDTNSKVYLTWQDNDVTDYCISTTNNSSNCTWFKTTNKSINAEYILQGKKGIITLYAFIKDKSGLVSNSKDDTITLNTTKPLIETFYIGGSNNPKYVTSPNSSIYLKWTEEDITEYCISEKNSSDDCSWQTISENNVNTSYDLKSGDGVKTLYAYIKNVAGLISNIASDNIILDTTKPTIQKFYIGGLSNPPYINNINPNIYAEWPDNDVVSYCLNITDDISKCEWQNISGKSLDTKYNLNAENNEKKLYLYIKDEAEHISEVKEDRTILDTEVPVIKEFYIGEKDIQKINTYKTKVTITSDDEDVAYYCISLTKDSLLCNWVKVDKNIIEAEYLLSEELGEKTLYAFIKDRANNISLVKEAKIILEIYENGVNNPLNSSPQTGTITVGVITIVGILIGITYYIIVKRKNKLYKL